ncbi:unnamed protein product [Linum trigynum]|uniref:Uncharacterized protein n=1 Tax=Linum trigynum TaxID=586398 RepID=A0AAV2FXE1_9ROSI
MVKQQRSIRREVAPALLKTRRLPNNCTPILETIQEESPRPRRGNTTALSPSTVTTVGNRGMALLLPVFISLVIFFFFHRDAVCLVGRGAE